MYMDTDFFHCLLEHLKVKKGHMEFNPIRQGGHDAPPPPRMILTTVLKRLGGRS